MAHRGGRIRGKDSEVKKWLKWLKTGGKKKAQESWQIDEVSK